MQVPQVSAIKQPPALPSGHKFPTPQQVIPDKHQEACSLTQTPHATPTHTQEIPTVMTITNDSQETQ